MTCVATSPIVSSLICAAPNALPYGVKKDALSKA